MLISYKGKYEAVLKQIILNSVSLNLNTENLLSKAEKNNGDKSTVSSLVWAKNVNGMSSVNNHESNYTSHNSEDRNLCEETCIRVNMDELNEKIKAGEIFCDNTSSRASNSNANAYNLII